jgi:hypothetical protein
MKSLDQIQLEEKYEQILNEKTSWKGALAGAALGLGTMVSGSAHASPMTSDDYADKEMISHSSQPDEPTPHEAFTKIIELVHSNQKVPKELINIVSTNKELTTRCSYLLIMKGLKLPEVFKKTVGNLEKEMKSSVVGP